MTTKSGWCIDEVQALDLGQPAAAERLHDRCSRNSCSCPRHEGEAA